MLDTDCTAHGGEKKKYRVQKCHLDSLSVRFEVMGQRETALDFALSDPRSLTYEALKTLVDVGGTPWDNVAERPEKAGDPS